MRKALEIGGIVAAAILIAFGIAAIVLAVGGHNTVSDNLKTQQITGTPDMASNSPAIAAEVKAINASQNALVKKFKAAGVTFTPSQVTIPGCSVAGEQVTSGGSARCFAEYMFIHAICQYCVASDLVVTLLAVATWARFALTQRAVPAAA